MKALLVTPLPPQPTGLSDYAKRILNLTRGYVEWTLAFPRGAEPLDDFPSFPLSELKMEHFAQPVVYQIGNSPHCNEVIETLLLHGGTALFHETNMHHVLRNIADTTGDWETYNEHLKQDYGGDSRKVRRIMRKKAKSLRDYDRLLRVYPLMGNLLSASTVVAVLSDTAKIQLEKMAPGKPVFRMGFLPDHYGPVERKIASDQPLTIGIAGTFHYGRSYEEMVEAVAMLRKTVDCRLLIAGSGWPESAFPWVTVTGRLSDYNFRAAVQQFDIAMDLRHHTCGETSGSMMDILKSGVPAVVTAEGSFRDIPADAVLRIPASSGAVGAYEALRYLVADPDLRASISKAAANYFAGISDSKKCLRQWLDLLGRSG